MTNRILFLIYYFLILFLPPLWAQTLQKPRSDGGNYVIEQRYVQKIEWIGGNYTLKYEVVIEQNDGGIYKAYIREFTEEPGLQISLPLGIYRYRVTPYDYLEQPGKASDWVNIEIKPAPIVSVEVRKAEDGSYVLHPYENEQIVPGVNEIIINRKEDPVTIGDNEIKKPLDVYVSAVWTPLIPLYGRLQEIFGNEFYAAGATVRFGVLFNKPRWFSPGIELSTSWYGLNNAQDGDQIDMQTGAIGVNIIAQKKLPYGMAVTLRAGFAVAFQIGEINIEDYSYATGGLIPQINVEASFLWFAYKQLYLEIGVGFTHLFGKDDNSGCLRPRLGVGWEF